MKTGTEGEATLVDRAGDVLVEEVETCTDGASLGGLGETSLACSFGWAITGVGVVDALGDELVLGEAGPFKNEYKKVSDMPSSSYF